MIYTLPQTIQQAAQKFPDKIAFKYLNRTLNYENLVQQVNQLSHALLEAGLQKGDRVGIFMNRCLETAIAIYGIMNAGGAYVPIDPYSPAERTRFVIADCGISVLITIPSQKRQLAEMLQQPTDLSHIIGSSVELNNYKTLSWQQVKTYASSNPKINILAADLAYIMYTSGSTGTPKGIMHTHYSGLSYAKLSADLYGVTAKDVIGNHAPLHFDISTFGYFTSMLVGATTVIVSDAHIKMPASLSKVMQEEKMTIWYSVPLALIQLLQRGVLEDRDLSALRWVMYGGEPFPVKHLRSLMKRWPQATFSNVYGPAEVNQCTYYHLKTPPQEDASIPIGQIWENTDYLILDDRDQEVISEEVGELLIHSATRMKGYWNLPDLTQKGFYIKKTHSQLDPVFYRTGDLVKRNEKGELLFMGRKDRQIKTRGYRVELDEVTAVLVAHEAIEEVAVYPLKNEAAETYIEAAIILKSNQVLEAAEVKKIAAEKLPLYAVPQTIKFLQDFPRGGTGKIDYKRLQILAGDKQ